MRNIRVILANLALLVINSCAIDNLELPDSSFNASDDITIFGRVTRFDDQNVETRGAKNDDEVKITSYAMAIFNLDYDNSGEHKCVHYEFHEAKNNSENLQLLFTLSRQDDKGNSVFAENTPHAIYVFANMPGMAKFQTSYEGTSLDVMLKETAQVSGITIPKDGFPGFPMIGSVGDTFSEDLFDIDGKVLIISPTNEKGELIAPTVGAEPTSTLNIPMKALYAKMNFTIEVRPDQVIEGFAPNFKIESYQIVNVPNSVDFSKTTNADVTSEIGVSSYSGVLPTNVVASGANKINFSFYLPENLLTPATTADKYDYPFLTKDEKGNKVLRTEDEKYRQRYKVKLLGSKSDGTLQPATNIVIKGTYSDHQQHTVNVTYTIYLGKDNYSNFDVQRNCEYNNSILIRGILNSEDGNGNINDSENYISIDHRVNIEHIDPIIVSLRREVLLDSHFEVRPLRIRANADFKQTTTNVPTHVRVAVDDNTDWIRVERSGGSTFANTKNSKGESIYITEDGPANGKRRFFTYNLVSGKNPNGGDDTSYGSLYNSTEEIVPINIAGECVWIYIDECTDEGDGVRSGTVTLSYGTLNNRGVFTEINSTDYPEIVYTFSQRKLFNVTGPSGRTYNIEYEEEYLHNFDSQESYGQTEFEGMPWGLDGQQLSYEDDAMLIRGTLWDGLINLIVKRGMNPKYDFYNSTAEAPDDDNAHPYNGFEFCKRIIQVINGYVSVNGKKLNGNSNDDIDILQLNEEPESAVEYCYNKNKRNDLGQVAWQNQSENTTNTSNLNWYLPAIDEIEDIVMSEYVDPDNAVKKTYSRFIEFQSQFYWSSQPAYYVYDWSYSGVYDSDGQFYIDALNNARSTSVTYLNRDYISASSEMSQAEKRHSWGFLGSNYEVQDTGKTPVYGAGYDSRTEKNRIRCVRYKPNNQ